MMRSWILCTSCLILCLATPFCHETAGAKVGQDAAVDAMKAAVEQWLHDVEFSCRYTYRMGEAVSIEAGLAGTWASEDDSKFFEGVLNKGLGMVRMSVVHGVPPKLVGKSGDNAEYTHVSYDEVASSDMTLRYRPRLEEGGRGSAIFATRDRVERIGLGPYDAGVVTKRQLTPLAIDGNEIGSDLSEVGDNSSDADTTVLEISDNHIVIRVSFTSGDYQVTKDVNLNLTLKHPVVQEIRSRWDNGAGTPYEAVSRATDFVDVEGVPIATVVRKATSGAGRIRVTEWKAVEGRMEIPTEKDFLVPIEENTRVRGVRRPERFLTGGMLDISKVRPDDISTVYEDEVPGFGDVGGGRSPFLVAPSIVLRENKGSLFVPPDEWAQLQISHTFEVANTTLEAWKLGPAGSSCNCYDPEIADAALEPGDTTDVTVTIEAAGRRGRVAGYAELSTNSRVVPRVFVHLQADVHPRLSLSGVPVTPVLVLSGGRKTLELDVISEQMVSEDQLHLELVPPQGMTCEAELGTPVLTHPDKGRRVVHCPLTVQLIAPAAANEAEIPLRRQTVEVKCGSYHVSQDILWRIVSPIKSHPRAIFMQSDGVRNVLQKVVLSSESSFSVRSVVLPSDSLSVDVAVDTSNTSHVATVTASKPFGQERDRFETHTIRFVTDHPQQEEVIVAVHVMASSNDQ